MTKVLIFVESSDTFTRVAAHVSKGQRGLGRWCCVTARGRKRDPPPEQEAAAAGTVDTTEEVHKTTGILQHVDPRGAGVEFFYTEDGEQMWRQLCWRKTPLFFPFFCFCLLLFLHAENEGAEWLRYALLSGLSVPQRAHWGAARQGGIPEAAAGRLHQPLQEGHAGPLRLRQRHRVLQQRRGMAGVWWADEAPLPSPPPLPAETARVSMLS